MTSLWKRLEEIKHIHTIKACAYRMKFPDDAVRLLVSTEDKYEILRTLIECADSLLKPFKEPSCHPSRFRCPDEPGLQYGSLLETTALCEAAFLRFRFMSDSDAKFHNTVVDYISFRAMVKTDKAIDLTRLPFHTSTHYISDAKDWSYAQKLGREMRHDQVEVCLYSSARDRQGANIAVFSSAALKHSRYRKDWRCFVSEQSITFYHAEKEKHVFVRKDFLVEGVMPLQVRS